MSLATAHTAVNECVNNAILAFQRETVRIVGLRLGRREAKAQAETAARMRRKARTHPSLGPEAWDDIPGATVSAPAVLPRLGFYSQKNIAHDVRAAIRATWTQRSASTRINRCASARHVPAVA